MGDTSLCSLHSREILIYQCRYVCPYRCYIQLTVRLKMYYVPMLPEALADPIHTDLTSLGANDRYLWNFDWCPTSVTRHARLSRRLKTSLPSSLASAGTSCAGFLRMNYAASKSVYVGNPNMQTSRKTLFCWLRRITTMLTQLVNCINATFWHLQLCFKYLQHGRQSSSYTVWEMSSIHDASLLLFLAWTDANRLRLLTALC